MSTTIAEYYTDELVEWNDSINFYSKEMDKLEQKLGEIISRNSIVGIAEKVEAHQTLLNELSDIFHRLQIEIQQQEAVFKTDSTLVDNTLINNETGMR